MFFIYSWHQYYDILFIKVVGVSQKRKSKYKNESALFVMLTVKKNTINLPFNLITFSEEFAECRFYVFRTIYKDRETTLSLYLQTRRKTYLHAKDLCYDSQCSFLNKYKITNNSDVRDTKHFFLWCDEIFAVVVFRTKKN
jgi:hypothetical protein